jgi:hypothetical protein
MTKKLLLLLMISSFLTTGPALAIRRVPKSNDQQAEQKQTQIPDKKAQVPDRQAPTPEKQAPAPGRQVPSPDRQAPTPEKAVPPPEQQPDRGAEHSRPQQPEQPHQSRDRDRFIDRDGDGINDNLKKPPETIKKRRDGERRHKETENRKNDHRSRHIDR